MLICGFPSSGNRLVASILEAHGVEAKILHWPKRRQVPEGEARCIQLVRDDAARRSSIKSRLYSWDVDERLAEHYDRTARLMAELRIPILPIRYEDLVADPEGTAARMLDWAGVEFVGLPCDIYDGNEKWLSR